MPCAVKEEEGGQLEDVGGGKGVGGDGGGGDGAAASDCDGGGTPFTTDVIQGARSESTGRGLASFLWPTRVARMWSDGACVVSG